MPGNNIWDGEGFSLESLTAAVNKEPYRPGQISATKLFEEDSVSTTSVTVESQDGKLGLVEPTARGGPGETTGDDDRDKRIFVVDHYQRDDFIMADEVQNVRAFGTEDELETIEGRVEKKAQKHAKDLTMTLEHQRRGAIMGNVTSKSGKVLHNLYSVFGIAAPLPVSLDLANDAAIVTKILDDLKHSIEDDLDAMYDGLHVFNGSVLHSEIWHHKSVRETFIYHHGAEMLRGAVPDVYQLGAITFERYRTGKKATADAGADYIAEGEGRVVAKGVPDLFITRFAPADYEETVNTEGLPFYAKQYASPNGKGRNLEVQMNAISLCTQPATLRKITL